MAVDVEDVVLRCLFYRSHYHSISSTFAVLCFVERSASSVSLLCCAQMLMAPSIWLHLWMERYNALGASVVPYLGRRHRLRSQRKGAGDYYVLLGGCNVCTVAMWVYDV